MGSIPGDPASVCQSDRLATHQTLAQGKFEDRFAQIGQRNSRSSALPSEDRDLIGLSSTAPNYSVGGRQARPRGVPPLGTQAADGISRSGVACGISAGRIRARVQAAPALAAAEAVHGGPEFPPESGPAPGRCTAIRGMSYF